MNSRREALKGLAGFAGGATVLGAGLVGMEKAEAAIVEGKPVTRAGLARSVLSLADRAEKAGLKEEANVLLEAALKVLGSPAAGR